MKSLANNILIMTIFTISSLLVGCSHQSSHLQNQYGPRAAVTQAKDDFFDDMWFSSKTVHHSFAASTNNNLGSQLVNETELAKPRALGPVNPMAAVGAVERYQKGQVRALSEVSVEVGGGNSSGQSD
jgi:hypothetical protein